VRQPKPAGFCCFIFIWAYFGAGLAVAQDSTLTRFIRKSQYPMVLTGGQFAGTGWEKIQQSIQKSQVVLVGESHGLAQVPAFTAAVAQVLKPVLYVAEIDRYVALELTRLTAQPGLPVAYLKESPEALCFYNVAEEFELARTLRAQHVRLVGIDQVYCTTAGRFYYRLADAVQNKPTKAHLRQRAAAYLAQDRAYELLGNDDWVMLNQSPAAIDSLQALTRNEGPAVQKMVRDYVVSYAIYKSQSHQDRLNLMKRNLLQEVAAVPPMPVPVLPKMLLKFGANHLGRGLSPVSWGEFYDVGNLVQDLAEAQDQKSLHILITGKQGTQSVGANTLLPDKNISTYTAANNPTFKLFFDQTSPAVWIVIDLRPARRAISAGKLVVADQRLQRTIMGYDYLVIIPETTASRLY
jgi:hypothetical protein